MKNPIESMPRLGPFVLASILTLAAAVPTARATGLVLYYPFESSGTPVSYTDTVSGVVATPGTVANTGTVSGAPRPVPHSVYSMYVNGTSGSAFVLSAFTDAVHKGAGSGLTISFWVRGKIQAARYLYGEGSTTENNSFFGLGTDGTGTKFRLYYRDKDGTQILNQTSNSTILNTAQPYYDVSNTWHHIVWTDSVGNAKLYVDGVLDTANFNYTPPAATALANFNTSTIAGLKQLAGIMSAYGTDGGVMDDFAVWDMVLPQATITALYNGTLRPSDVAPPPPPPPAPLTALNSLSITYRNAATPQVDVDWQDSTLNWTLETSRNLQDWAHIDVAKYTIPQTGAYRVTEDSRVTDFYRLRKVGSPNLYVIGDSISTPGAWPKYLAPLSGRHTFSQAIGGTTSPSMVARARGVELSYPLTNPVTPAIIHMKWRRHIADRTHDNTYKSQWAYYAKAVSEPTSIEVYQHGRYIGSAVRSLKNFTTNFVGNPKTITCPGHGFVAGDRVTFISNDPAYPDNLDVNDSAASWNFTSPYLPSAIVERRVYFAANVTTNTFELKELSGDATTLNIGSNATGSPSIECGWAYDVNYTGGTWDVTWTARTKYDDWIWLLEVSANDMPTTNAVTNLTIPNNLLLLKQMIEINPRFLMVCPTSGSFLGREPGSVNWNNFYNIYMPWVKTNFPDNYIDTMAIFDALRTTKEKGLLLDPAVPELLWLDTTGTPGNQASWFVYRTSTANTRQTWIGPGYIPLQLRTSFGDDIHPNNLGNQTISNAVAAKITAKGW